ncbi:hypothetical protein [Flavobacterium sp.]|jgi:hypothetical protein|uniref:hypothetical protein n=1 Tax=Flavobacterium sp. TaxID=239 RepID=UPI0037BE71F2
MKKLNLDALKERAGAIASTELLASISGGTDNACHDKVNTRETNPTVKDNIPTIRPGGTLSPPGQGQ